MEKTPEKEAVKQQLLAPLPEEAITQHPTKSFLSSIKAIYVTERLNDVFGVGAWTTKVEYVTDAPSKPRKDGTIPTMVVVKLTLEVPSKKIYYEAYGGNDNEDLGDAYKGAMTDALTKIGSFMGIGIDVFKGLHGKKQPMMGQATGTKIMHLVKILNVDVKELEKMTGHKLTELPLKEANQLIKNLEAKLTDEQKKQYNNSPF